MTTQKHRYCMRTQTLYGTTAVQGSACWYKNSDIVWDDRRAGIGLLT